MGLTLVIRSCLRVYQKSVELSVMLDTAVLLADGAHGYMAASTGVSEIGTCEVPTLRGTV